MIEDFTIRFENGCAVNYSAKKGEQSLRKLLETDKNAVRLGEVALVPHSSPISQSGILFYNTVFDENAASHIALGNAYRTSIQGGDDMSDEEFAASGGNKSLIHVDFMIGSAGWISTESGTMALQSRSCAPGNGLSRSERGNFSSCDEVRPNMPRDYTEQKPTAFQRLPEYKRDDEWIRAFPREARVGHIATSRDEQPFLNPSTFWFDEEDGIADRAAAEALPEGTRLHAYLALGGGSGVSSPLQEGGARR